MTLRALTSSHLGVLHQLAIGRSHATAAAALFLSIRAVDARVADLKRSLGTSHRLCLGARAVRHRLIHPRDPVEYAGAVRPGPDWCQPTKRQLQAVQSLAGGASADHTCLVMGVSARTLRRDVAHLARANGPRTLVHAGALFEALGWT